MTRLVLPTPCGSDRLNPDHLIRLLGVDAEREDQFDRLVELGAVEALDQIDGRLDRHRFDDLLLGGFLDTAWIV